MVEWLTLVIGAIGIVVISSSAAALLAVATYGLVHMARDKRNVQKR